MTTGRDPAPIDVAALRAAEFPWADANPGVYLNSASTGPLPVRTVRVLEDWARRRAEPWRIATEEQFGTMAEARELCARLVGGEAGEVALQGNTSSGINLAARALPLGAGDVVLAHDGDFPANIYPWMALLAERGVRLELVPRTADGLPDEERLLDAIGRPEVRAVTVSWVGFATGHRADLARIGARCRERGAFFVVDAIQGVGAAPLDARACGIDVLACGAQKWLLSPWGSGFAWVRRELVAELAPPVVGWMNVRGSDDFARLVDYDLTWRDDARRFEVVTLPYQDLAAMAASLRLLHDLGVERVASHVAGLVARVVAWAAGRDDMVVVTPADPARRAGIVALRPRDAAAASRRLDAAGVTHSLREGMIRLSPHCFNTSADVERALEALD